MEGCGQFWHAEGTFREGHRNLVMPKQGEGWGISDRGARANRDMALGKRKAPLGELLVPRVAKAFSSK